MKKAETALRVPVAARRDGLTTRPLYGKLGSEEVAPQREKNGMVVIPIAEVENIGG